MKEETYSNRQINSTVLLFPTGRLWDVHTVQTLFTEGLVHDWLDEEARVCVCVCVYTCVRVCVVLPSISITFTVLQHKYTVSLLTLHSYSYNVSSYYMFHSQLYITYQSLPQFYEPRSASDSIYTQQ